MKLRLCLWAVALLPFAGHAEAALLDFRADLDGAQASAGTGSGSPGTGTAIVSFDTETELLSWEISYQNLTGAVTVGHFHGPALPGQGAGVRVGVPAGPSPIVGSTMLSDEAAFDELTAGLWYLNLHTAANPTGEIRGQVLPVERQSPLVRGDLVVLDGNTAQVVKIDPASGAETVLSAQVAIEALLDVTVTPDGSTFAIDVGDRLCRPTATRSLVRLDTRTGRSEVALSAIDGSRVASDSLGRIYLLSTFLTRFDPATGAVDLLSFLGTSADLAISPADEIFVMRMPFIQTGAPDLVRVDPSDGSFETVGAGGMLARIDDRTRALEVDSTGRLIVLQTNDGVGELLAIDPTGYDPMAQGANQAVLASGGFLSAEVFPGVQDLAVDGAGDLVVMQDRLAELVRVGSVSGVQTLTAFDPIEGPFLDSGQLGQLTGGVAIAPDGRPVRALSNCLLGTTGLVLSSFEDGTQSFVTSTGLLSANGLLRLGVAPDGSDVFVSALIEIPLSPESSIQIFRVDPGLGLQQFAFSRGFATNAGGPIFDLDAAGRIVFPDCQGLSNCETQSFDPANPGPPSLVTSAGPLENQQPLDLVVGTDGFVYQLGSAQIVVRVDPETGQQFGGLPTGDSGLPASADQLAVTPDGVIYAAGDSVVFSTGLSGGGTIVGIGGLLEGIQAIVAGPSGQIYAATASAIVEIDPTRNPAVNQTLVASLPDRSLLDLAVVMPEPSASWLACAALLALTLLRATRTE